MLKTVTPKEFLESVEHEVKALKFHATEEELSRLNFNNLNPEGVESCIYGQMTGYCDSPRAKELMDYSCIRQSVQLRTGATGIKGKDIEVITHLINNGYEGSTWRNHIESFYNRSFQYLSALEVYITLKNAKNKEIIDYLKGESETLEL